ncbi:MAG TPA: hypothetical protein VND64_12355 [Pirellulales bacterium]|nr:hypothetical protein [Pirellulales bacterium]
MNLHSSSAHERPAKPAKRRERIAPLVRFDAMLANEGFEVLESEPLFKQWVTHTQLLLNHPNQCDSALAAWAMFELHSAGNPDLEQFIAQINLLLEEGREELDLAVVGRAMVVGLAITLEERRQSID